MTDLDIRPDEFALAAQPPIADAAGRAPRDAARVLAEAGLTGVCATEDVGGLGLDIAFALPLAIAAGRAQLKFPLIEQLLVAKALGSTPQAEQLCSGARIATWALQGGLQSGLAGHARGAADADWVLVADSHGGAALCERASLTLETVAALDPEHPQAWLTLDHARVITRIEPAVLRALQRDLDILAAGYVNGVASAALARSAEHTTTRVQFSQPLANRQAVRHHLARMCLVTEAVDASVHRVLLPDEDGHVRDTRPMLAHAIAQSAWVLEKAIHLHGGMGFTWEVPLHHGLREIRKFDAAFGAGALARQAGQDFIAAA